jgi:hypothetical protein
MRIIIETPGQGELSVVQDGQAASLETPGDLAGGDLDGGGAPQELVELLGGTLAAGKDPIPEASAGRSTSAEDAGAPPDWLVEVIEGQGSTPGTTA